MSIFASLNMLVEFANKTSLYEEHFGFCCELSRNCSYFNMK